MEGLINGGLPIRHVSILSQKILPPDNATFYTIRIVYTDGYAKVYENIPDNLFNIYMSSIFNNGRTPSSIKKNCMPERPKSSMTYDL